MSAQQFQKVHFQIAKDEVAEKRGAMEGSQIFLRARTNSPEQTHRRATNSPASDMTRGVRHGVLRRRAASIRAHSNPPVRTCVRSVTARQIPWIFILLSACAQAVQMGEVSSGEYTCPVCLCTRDRDILLTRKAEQAASRFCWSMRRCRGAVGGSNRKSCAGTRSGTAAHPSVFLFCSERTHDRFLPQHT